VSEQEISTLREQVAALTDGRPHDYIKALVELAQALPPGEEKIERFMEVADLYANRFKNQAEAISAYEAVLEIDPANAPAIVFLREAYEKRRDWEKLIALRQREANMLDGVDRLNVHREIAQLATDRIKKPALCIDLWAVVLDADPNDLDALRALGQLYERDREYEKLADILERLAQFTPDQDEQKKTLVKLGQVTGDRLKDDARAAEAYRQLCILEPDDKRHQEQLKKRYIALGRWDELEMFYAQSDRWDEFIRILESNESRADSDEQRITMLMKVAELWMTQKGKPDRAARAYEKVLGIDSGNLDAAERLIPIYEAAGNSRGLIGAIEVKLQHTEDAQEKLALLRQVSELYQQRGGDKQLAFQRLVDAFELFPEDEQVQADVEEAARGAGAWAQLVEAYDKVLRSGEVSDTVGLRLRLGRILVEELERVDDALEHYRAVCEEQPDNEQALGALEALYQRAGRSSELLDIYQRRVELAGDPHARKQLLFAMARLYEGELAQPEQAMATYQTVLDDDPADADALAALDALYQRTGDWEALGSVLQRRIELEMAEEPLLDLKYRLAQVQHAHLGASAEALDNYREILVIQQSHEGARNALEEMLDSPLTAEAAAILESIYELTGEWQQLLKVSQILVKATRDPERKVELLRKMALTAATQLGDAQAAFDAQARAVEADPSLSESRDELEAFAARADAWPRLVTLYTKIAEGLDDASLAREYWVRIATIQEQRGEIDEAAGCFERLLELDPGDLEALQALDNLFRTAERWTDLVQVYRKRIDLSIDEQERERLYSEMAMLLDEMLQQPEQAIAAYREVLAFAPTSLLALGALDALFERQQRWTDLAENIEARLNLVDSEDEQLALVLRLASLRETKMSDVDGAVDGYRQVLDRDPMNQVALAALERLGADPEHELMISEILEPLYRDRGEYAKLISVYEVQERREADPIRKVALLHQIAQLHEDAAADLAAAFDTYGRALAVDPSNEATLESLDRLARMTGRFQDLAGHYEALGGAQEDPEIAAQLLTLAARTIEQDVGDAERAVALYRRVLSLDPMNLAAAEALQNLYQASNRYEETSLVLQQKAQIVEDLDEQKEALYQAAAIEQELLNRPQKAVEVYRKVLAIDEEDMRSIDALIELHLGLENWSELLEVQSQKADLVLDPDERKAIYYTMGSVFERELKDTSKAIDVYQRVLELDPDDIEALGRLDVLHTAAENWNELLSVLTQEAELIVDADEAISYQYRIAELYERRLDDVERAVDLYRDVLNIQPAHTPTLAALERIKEGDVAPLQAAQVLEPVYEVMGDYQRLIGALAVQVAHNEDVFGKVDLLHRIATLYEESLGNFPAAFDTLAQAIALNPRNEETLTELERLAMTLGRWQDVARVYEAELAHLEDIDEKVELGMRVAQIYEVQLEDLQNAVNRYREVLQADPENQGALRALDRLFTQAERWEELVPVLERQAEVGDTPDDILEFRYRLGQVRQHRLDRVDEAIAAYAEVLTASPEHAPAREALEGLFAAGIKQPEIGATLGPLYQATGEWEKLSQVRLAQLDQIEDLEQRLELYYEIADDTEHQLYDATSAFLVYSRALSEAPLDERTGLELERLAADVDDGWVNLATLYADVIGQEGVSAETQATLGKRLARVYEEELADVEKAKESYGFVLSVLPGDPTALENLDRIYSSLEEWVDLAAVLEQRANVVDDDEERVLVLTRLGEVYETNLGQIDDAERAYRRVFDGLDPNNEEAIAALSRLFEAKEAWEDLSRVYERQLEIARDPLEEAEVLSRLARLKLDRLGQLEAAAEGWRRVLDIRGEDGEALNGLADIYEHQEQWAELSDVLERFFENADSDEERVLALSRRARLFSDRLGRDDEALETWRRVLDLDYANVPALRAVADIWRRKQDPRELVAALHAIVDQASDQLEAPELAEVHRELGKIYGEVLEQPFEATEAWTHLVEVAPKDFEGLAELEKLYRADERWEDVVRVKIQRADAFEEPAEKIRELLEVTEMWRQPLENYDGATEAYTKILEVDPLHQVAFDEVEKLHKAASRWEPLIEAYLARVEATEDLPARSDLWRRIARVFEEKVQDLEQAFVALDQAFKEDIFDDVTAAYLGRMAQATGRWKELIADTQAALEVQEDVKARIQLCLTLGKWYGEDLGMMEYANAYYAQVVQMDPGNVRVLRQMANIYRLGGNWRKAGETLHQAEQAAVHNDDRKMVYVDMGDLLRKHMNETDQGIGYYKRALGVDPHLLPALEALEQIYTERGAHSELAEVLKRMAEALTKPEELVETKLRLAQLYENNLQDADAALEVYDAVVAIDGSNLEALRGQERAHERQRNWPELVTVLENQLHCVQSERERVDVLLKLARIQEEEFLKADLAAQRLERALEIDPTEREAYVALGRCYRRLKRWEDLIRTSERFIDEVAEHADKLDLYAQIGQVYSDELDDAEQAIQAYQSIVDLDPTNIVALDALARLYEKRGDVHESIDCLTRVADLTSDGVQRVDMYYRIGRASLEKLGDRITAREKFEQALDLDPAHLPTLGAIRAIAEEEHDWDAAARYVDQEQSHTQSARARAKLLVALGDIREQNLGESELAIESYKQAIELDPELEEAAAPLLEHYVSVEDWAAAEPLAELLVRRSRNLDRGEQHRLNNILGKVLAALQKNAEALAAYQAAFQFDVTSQETIRGIAEVSYRVQDWPTALANYQKVLTALGEDEIDERTEVYFRLGCIKREQGQAKQAINNFEKALSLNGEHRATLDALVEVYAKAKNWAQVAEYKRQILDCLADEEERFALLMDIGDVWTGDGKNVNKAIEAMEEAQELKPNDHVLLHKLLQLYQRAEEWSKMVDTIHAISDLEEAPERKARYYYTMAQLYRDKIDDADRAVELFNEALDLHPAFLEAFERINKILTQNRNWKQLERAYRKMLHRIAGKGNAELEHELWYQLGLIYRDRIGDRDKAIDAFKMASHSRPDDLKDRHILSELYEVSERFDEAVEQQRFILEKDPLKLDPYRSLYRLFLHKRTYDEAWCAAAAISFMQKAEPEEYQFFEDYRPQGILQVKGRLNNELWNKALFHPTLNIYVSKIFEAIAAAALKAKMAQMGGGYRPPDKNFREDVATSTITFARTFGWTAQVLGVPIPELYIRNDQPGAIKALVADPRASEAGRAVLSGFQPHEFAFICGKHLASHRPELFIRNLFPAQTDLTVMLFAGMVIADPKTPLPQELATNVRATAQALSQFMDTQARDYLGNVVKRFVQEGAKVNIKTWMRAAELTACRAALLVCGDLEVAKKILSAEGATPELTAADKMKDLLVFTLSENYAVLRKALGVEIPTE
jgi:tetratricopeptide (TPR) repeat protein